MTTPSQPDHPAGHQEHVDHLPPTVDRDGEPEPPGSPPAAIVPSPPARSVTSAPARGVTDRSSEAATTRGAVTEVQQLTCPACGADPAGSSLFARLRVCDRCGQHLRMSARERIASLVDEGSFSETNRRLVSVDPLAFADRVPYRQRLRDARKQTGLLDAVVTGTGRLAGHRVVLAVVDFGFLGGTMGSVVGEKVAAAFELALQQKLPIITVVSSGGARMQEGMLSLMQMAKTAAAAERLHRAGVPFISVVTDPTTGGVWASFASLGDIIIAEPGALIGFAGPRVAVGVGAATSEATGQEPRRAERLLRNGHVDLIVERAKLRDTLTTLVGLLRNPVKFAPTEPEREYTPRPPDASQVWRTVSVARHTDRPTSLDYIHRMLTTFVELHGDRLYGDDPAIVAGLGAMDGETLVVIGQERGHAARTGNAAEPSPHESGAAGARPPERNGGRVRPEGYRKALRLMRLAAKFRLPLLTLIDTPGAWAGDDSEARGIAGALAACLAEMSVLPIPIVSAVIGEGGSGGALALGVADRILMLEHAIYSVIAPEGAAAILYRDPSKAAALAPAMKITAADCLQLGVIDEVVPEPAGGAHTDPEQAARYLLDAVRRELSHIQRRSGQQLVKERYRKFRAMGRIDHLLHATITEEMGQMGENIRRLLEGLLGYLPRRGAPQAAK